MPLGLPLTQTPCEGLEDIMHRDYFSRIWVVQEAALAREVNMQVGREKLSWRNGLSVVLFHRRLKLAEISPQWTQAGLRAVDLTPLREILEQSVIKLSTGKVDVHLLDIIHNLRHRHSSDPRDMILALLSLAPDALGPDFQPDYNLSNEETFLNLYNHVKAVANRRMNLLDRECTTEG